MINSYCGQSPRPQRHDDLPDVRGLRDIDDLLARVGDVTKMSKFGMLINLSTEQRRERMGM